MFSLSIALTFNICVAAGLAPAGIGKLKEVAAIRVFCSTITAGHPPSTPDKKHFIMNFRAYSRHVLYYEYET